MQTPLLLGMPPTLISPTAECDGVSAQYSFGVFWASWGGSGFRGLDRFSLQEPVPWKHVVVDYVSMLSCHQLNQSRTCISFHDVYLGHVTRFADSDWWLVASCGCFLQGIVYRSMGTPKSKKNKLKERGGGWGRAKTNFSIWLRNAFSGGSSDSKTQWQQQKIPTATAGADQANPFHSMWLETGVQTKNSRTQYARKWQGKQTMNCGNSAC